MEVFHLPPGARRGKGILLEGEEAHHILRVRRLGLGSDLRFTEGDGRFVHAVLDRIQGRALHATVQEEIADPRETGAPRLVLAVALLKSDHLELALEKAVELGVHRFVPLLAERCVVQWKEKAAERKLQRWERIALGAMKQSQRSWRCRIQPPLPLREAVEQGGPALLVVADEAETGARCEDLAPPPAGEIWGLVGPEGGFSDEEKAWLADRGGVAVTLSPYRLRSETAAVVLAQRLAATAPRPA